MEIRLNDDEIREALTEALNRKVDYAVTAKAEECWFEVKAGVINGEDVDDIHDVQFCFKTDT